MSSDPWVWAKDAGLLLFGGLVFGLTAWCILAYMADKSVGK